VKRGDTFMIEDDHGTCEHLHVVLTEPSLAGEVITASISTRRRWSEALIFIQVGEHPWIRAESIVPYRYASIRPCKGIEAALADGTARVKEPASDALVKKMCGGLIESTFTHPDVTAFYKAVSKARAMIQAPAVPVLPTTPLPVQ
jgi:hypothetical protein